MSRVPTRHPGDALRMRRCPRLRLGGLPRTPLGILLPVGRARMFEGQPWLVPEMVPAVSERWPLALLIGLWGLMTVIGVLIVLTPPRNRDACDRIFAEFMATNDVVVVNRDGWLLYLLDCNSTRRFRKYQQELHQ